MNSKIKKKKIKFKKGFKLGVLVFLIVIIILTIIYLLTPVSSSDKEEIVTIKSGTSTSEIATILKDKKLIKSKTFFTIYSKIKRAKYYAASYKLSPNMSLNEIINELQTTGNDIDEIAITIKEGQNMRQIAKLISENTNIKYDDIIKKSKDQKYLDKLINKYWFIEKDIKNINLYYNLEGYLFPDTYEFANKDVSVDAIITTLLNEFNKKVSPYKEEIENSDYNIHELITLASIAESESLPGADRKKVVSVSINRMKSGMSLGSDMTAYYAYKLDDYSNGGLTLEQFNDCSSPYNTRCSTKMGLPIGPISNPSLDSIVGAIEYEETTYLYYVADCSGVTYFTNTYNEFINKINELQQQEKWCEVSK